MCCLVKCRTDWNFDMRKRQSLLWIKIFSKCPEVLFLGLKHIHLTLYLIKSFEIPWYKILGIWNFEMWKQIKFIIKEHGIKILSKMATKDWKYIHLTLYCLKKLCNVSYEIPWENLCFSKKISFEYSVCHKSTKIWGLKLITCSWHEKNETTNSPIHQFKVLQNVF